MSKKNLKNEILKKIKKGEIKMKPRWYFILGSIITFFGFLFSTISAILIFNLILFLFRTHYGPMYHYRLQLILTNYPWWLIILGIILLILGIKILKNYDFSYKKNFLVIIIVYFLIIFLSVYLIDYFNLNKSFYNRGFIKRFYENKKQIFKDKNLKYPKYLR